MYKRCDEDHHYVGEFGTYVYVDCGEDVSDASNIYLYLKRPDGTIVKRTGEAVTYKSSTNFVRAMIEAGDFNQAGDYTCQVGLTLGVWSGKGEEFIIKVEEGESSSSSSSVSSSSSSSTA